jgi:acetyl-CoA carboxylase carboxyl transferase subunit beta
MAWFKKKHAPLDSSNVKKGIPVGVWVKCEGCSAALFSRDLEENLKVCPKCHYHFRLTAGERVAMLADDGTFEEICGNLSSADPLSFVAGDPYPKRIQDAQKKTGMFDAIVAGQAKLEGRPAVLSVMDFGFIGGSMGSVVGEKVSRSALLALELGVPYISVASSGGARMQEGMFSLMQMAKTSAAVERLKNSGGLFISVLTNPTMAGVTASFAMLGDLIIAEPDALVGFAGPRVIEQTIRQKLPKGFQTAEFVKQHGFVDRIVPRHQLKKTLALLIELLPGDKVGAGS